MLFAARTYEDIESGDLLALLSLREPVVGSFGIERLNVIYLARNTMVRKLVEIVAQSFFFSLAPSLFEVFFLFS